MTHYDVNWLSGEDTPEQENLFKQGETLIVKSKDAKFLTIGIYQDGSPILINQSPIGQDWVSVKVDRKNLDIKGKALLKTEIYTEGWKRQMFSDDFIII